MSDVEQLRALITVLQETEADLRNRLTEKENELEEFQESSRLLEEELETQLTSSEKRNQELMITNQKLLNENDDLKNKLNTITRDSSVQVEQLTSALQDLQRKNEVLLMERRDLEQKNDDFERSTRNLSSALEDFKDKLNEQIEKNVFLELELGEKGNMEDTIQRLKDYVKDLELELKVQHTRQSRGSISSGTGTSIISSNRPSTNSVSTPPSNNLKNPVTNGHHNSLMNGTNSGVSSALSNPSSPTISSPPTTPKRILGGIPLPRNPLTSPPSANPSNHQTMNSLSKNSNGASLAVRSTSIPSNLVNNLNGTNSPPSTLTTSPPTIRSRNGGGIPTLQSSHPVGGIPTLMSPTTRTSALNIVSDLLRKVGALESKLASCRNLVPPGTPVKMASSCNKSTSVTPLNSPTKAVMDRTSGC